MRKTFGIEPGSFLNQFDSGGELHAELQFFGNSPFSFMPALEFLLLSAS
jgi:hypothetical protein